MDDSPPTSLEATLATSAETVTLDRKISQAIQQGKGIRLTGEQLDLLVEIGLMDMLSQAKAAALASQARQRRAPRAEHPTPLIHRPAEPDADQRRVDAAFARAVRAVSPMPGKARRSRKDTKPKDTSVK